MRRPILAVDQDDVLAVLLDAWVRVYNQDFKDTLTVDDIDSWMISNIVKPEAKDIIFSYLDDAAFMESLDVKEGSQDALRRLSKHFEIFVVTAPKDYAGVVPKANWLARHFPFIPPSNYVFTMNKSIVLADFLVDDGVHNLERFQGTPILFNAPHNQGEERFARVKNWVEAEALILKLSREKKLL